LTDKLKNFCCRVAVTAETGIGTGWVLVAVMDGVVEAPLLAVGLELVDCGTGVDVDIAEDTVMDGVVEAVAVGSELVDCGAGVNVDAAEDVMVSTGGKSALAPYKHFIPRSIANIFIWLGGQSQRRATSSLVLTTFLISVKWSSRPDSVEVSREGSRSRGRRLNRTHESSFNL
jgi:hypothetical protein